MLLVIAAVAAVWFYHRTHHEQPAPVDAASSATTVVADAINDTDVKDAKDSPQAKYGSELTGVPKYAAHVTDLAAALSSSEAQDLETLLVNFERERGSQIAVLIVASTGPEDIAVYTQRVGDSWKIGRKGVGDGLLMVVAKNDRTVRIAPATTLEGAIPDVMAKRVIDEHIVPAFKRGDYALGLQSASQALIALIKGENLPKPVAPERKVMSWPFALMFVFVLLGVPLKIGLSVLGVPKKVAWIMAAIFSAAFLYAARQPEYWSLQFFMMAGWPLVMVGFMVSVVWDSIKNPAAPSRRRSRNDDDDDRNRSSSSSSSSSSSRSSSSSGGGGSFSGGGSSGSW